MSTVASANATTASRTSRVRWLVVAALFLLSFLTIVDRVAISAAKSDIARDLAISDMAFGWVFGVFALGYAIFQIPSGWLADRYGPRWFLTAIVVLWSLFTGLTGLVYGTLSLIIVRFLFGLAEAGAYPGAARAFYSWLPTRERGTAQGLIFAGSRLGAAFGLGAVSFAVVNFGWRVSFLILAVAGFVWGFGWLLWFRDDPAAKGSVSRAELDHIRADAAAAKSQDQPEKAIDPREATSWRALLLSRNSYLLLTQYFASNFTFFICFSWLLPYLKDQYNLTVTQAGLYASIPLYLGATANWISGMTVDFIYRRGHWRLSRLAPAISGFGLAAVMLVAATRMSSVEGAVICFAFATLGVDLTLSPSWTSCIDIAGKRTGTMSGAMNMMGNLGSFASSVTFPFLLRLTGSASAYFYLAALINVIAILCWLGVRPEKAAGNG